MPSSTSAPDARSADGAVDGAPHGGGAYDAAAPDAAQAGEGVLDGDNEDAAARLFDLAAHVLRQG